MTRQRYRLNFNVGSWLELIGAATFCVGLGLKFGLWLALIAAGVLLVVAAEFVYDQAVVRVPLPHRPRLRKPKPPEKMKRLWRVWLYGRWPRLVAWAQVKRATMKELRCRAR